MSTDITSNNSNKEDKTEFEPKLDYKRISVTFVDSVFNQINLTGDQKDPLNSTAKVFYSREPKKNIQEKPKTPVKQNQKPENLEIPKKSDINTNTINIEKSDKFKKLKINNYNNSYKQKKLAYNSSVKNKNKSNKPLNNNNIKPNIRDLNKGKKTYSSINENYKAKIESEKEKKLYQEKVKMLENRIFTLKNHEDEIHRRMHYNDIRQTYLNQKRKEKNDMKQALLSYDIDKRNELDFRRKAIKGQKNSLNKHLKESIEKAKITKMKDYENMQKEKRLALSIIKENNNKFLKYGKKNVKKIQREREQIKQNEINKQQNFGKTNNSYYLETCEDNKNETNKLKNKLKMLEKLEIKYMNSLNKTRQGMLRTNSEGVYFYKKDMVPIQKLDLEKNLNENQKFKRNNKINTSVDNLNKNEDNENKH